TTSPVLQRWFAATGHPAAKDPYFLYAASNAGSLLGLLGYPLLMEPRLTLAAQQWVWATGVGVYLLMVLACAACLFRERPVALAPASGPDGAAATPPDDATPQSPIGTGRILRWVALAALP